MYLRGTVLWRERAANSHVQQAEASWRSGLFQIREGKIYLLEETAKVPPGVPLLTGWAIPGLVDVHCHIGYGKSGELDCQEQRAQMIQARSKGILAIRDAGSPVDTSWLQKQSNYPQLLRAGRHIARPYRYIKGLGIELENPYDLPQEVLNQVRRGDGWVKIVADWIDRSMGAQADLAPLWETEILKDAVAAAHESGARVCAHSFSHSAIEGLLEAGVDGIEHGTGMDSDQIKEAVRQGISLTPTMLQTELFPVFAAQAGNKYPVYAKTMSQLYRRRIDTLQAQYDAGMLFLPGTDAGGYQQVGAVPRELEQWLQIGVPAQQIVDFATWKARDFLGLPVLFDGARADLVCYGEDPREDLSVLDRPQHIILGGVCYRP